MKERSRSHNLAENFEIDFKAEVIAAELLGTRVDADQVVIVSLGPARRTFRKDVDEVIDELSDFHQKEYTLITTHKEGLYDMLPEGMFHSPALPKSATTQQEIIDSIKQHRVEERNARRFFLPYEAAINHLRIQVALYETKLDRGAQHNDLVDIFKTHWKIFKWLNTEQSNIFLQLLPRLHDIRGDYKTAEKVLEQIFSIPVSITSQHQVPFKPGNPFFSALNDTKLGISFTTGNVFFETGEEEIIVTIGPMDNEQLSHIVAGTSNDNILSLLYDCLLPVHLDVTTRFELYERDKSTRLADKVNEYNATLGLCTYL